MLDIRETGVHYKRNVFFHSVTLNLKLREDPKWGMHYKPEVRVSLREYSIAERMPRGAGKDFEVVAIWPSPKCRNLGRGGTL